MGKLKEKVSYLSGLIEGMALGETKESKLFTQIVSVLNEISETVDELERNMTEMEDYIECLDEDLGILENDYYGLDEDEIDDDNEDDELDFVEIECPHCREKVYIEEETAYGEDPVFCPNCNEQIQFVEEDEEETDKEK